MTADRGENEALGVKPCHSAISFTTKATWTAPGLRDRQRLLAALTDRCSEIRQATAYLETGTNPSFTLR